LVRVRFLTYLLAVGLIAGSLLLLVGCGGGGEQNGQSKGSTAEQTAQKGPGTEKTNKQAAASWHEFKGTVTGVLPDKDNLTVKRNNGKAKTFKYNPDKVKVKLDGKDAGPDAIEKGQWVKINYMQYAKGNIAHSVRIRSGKSGASGGETTGG
jgi:hypothetical protein